MSSLVDLLLDLPLELKRTIYTEITGYKPSAIFGCSSGGRRQLRNLQLSDPLLHDEIDEWAVEGEDTAKFVIGPQPWDSPSQRINFNNLSISIVIDHYKLPQHSESDTEAQRREKETKVQDEIELIRRNMEHLSALLGRFDSLGSICVDFCDAGTSHGLRPRGDGHWCTAVYGVDPDRPVFLLKALSTAPRKPIVKYILEPLLYLPTCRFASVLMLHTLDAGWRLDVEEIRSNKDNVNIPYYNVDYGEHLFSRLEEWLQGNRPPHGIFDNWWRKGVIEDDHERFTMVEEVLAVKPARGAIPWRYTVRWGGGDITQEQRRNLDKTQHAIADFHRKHPRAPRPKSDRPRRTVKRKASRNLTDQDASRTAILRRLNLNRRTETNGEMQAIADLISHASRSS